MLGLSFLLAVGLLLVVVSIITSTVIISKEGDPGQQGNVGPQGSDFATLLTTESGGTNSSQTLLGGKLIVTSTKDSMVEGTSALNPVFNSLTLQNNQNQILIGSESLVSALSVETPAVNRTVSLSTLTNADVVLSEGDQLIRGEKTLNKIIANDNLLIEGSLIVAKQLQTQGSLSISNSKSDTDASLRINNQNPSSGSERASVVIQGNSSLALTPITIKQEGVLGLATYENKTATGFELGNEKDTFLTIENNQTWLISKEVDQLLFGNGFGIQLNVTPSILTPIYTLPNVSTDASIVLSEGNQLVYGQKTLSNIIAQLIQPARNTQTLNQLVLGSALSSTTISAPPATSRVITIPDPGTLLADFMLTEGNQTINGQKTFTDLVFGTLPNITLSATANQIGLSAVGQRTTISAPTPAASIIYTIPDTILNSQFVMTEGAQTINGAKTFIFLTALNLLADNLISNSNGSIQSTSNQIVIGSSGEVTLNVPTPPASVTYIIPESVAQMEFMMTTGDQVIRGPKTLTAGLICSQNLNITGNLVVTSATVTSTTRQNIQVVGQLIPANSNVIMSFPATEDALNWPAAGPTVLVFPQTGRYACSYGLNFPQHNQGYVEAYMSISPSEIFGAMRGNYDIEGFSLSLAGYGTITANAGSTVSVQVTNATNLNMVTETGTLKNFFNAYYLGP